MVIVASSSHRGSNCKPPWNPPKTEALPPPLPPPQLPPPTTAQGHAAAASPSLPASCCCSLLLLLDFVSRGKEEEAAKAAFDLCREGGLTLLLLPQGRGRGSLGMVKSSSLGKRSAFVSKVGG